MRRIIGSMESVGDRLRTVVSSIMWRRRGLISAIGGSVCRVVLGANPVRQETSTLYQALIPRQRFRCMPSMFESLGVKVPYPADGGEGLAEHKGSCREAVSEGSAEQNRDLTNRNWILGILGRTSGQRIAKSSIHH